ncbi:melanocortin receptor 3-like [Porites lutea]|uniref:melanocortin receptor 3-like n=1 Tax=Porites lutea TaxID=51062 RepID=UPI003CC66254
MASKFCIARLNESVQLVRFYEVFITSICVLNLVFSLVATIGNILVIRALRKASSIPPNVKTLFLSLASSDLAVGVLSQPMYGAIMAVMLKMASSGENNFALFCPILLNACYYIINFLSCTSFLNVIAIAFDRLLAIWLHLRYAELATAKRVLGSVVLLWLTSSMAALIFIVLPGGNFMVAAIIDFVGLFLTSMVYIRVFRVARSHENQIHQQLSQAQNAEALELMREKKSAYNALYVYFVFLACYFPLVPSIILMQTDESKIFFVITYHASMTLVFLNSSLNPIVYCWRYREVREIVKSTLKRIIHINPN